MEHAHVEYTVTPNDADPGSLQSQVKISSRVNPAISGTSGLVNGSGDLTAGLYATSAMHSDPWLTEVTLNYTVGGVPKTLTVSSTAVKHNFSGWTNAESVSDAQDLGGGNHRLNGKVSYVYRTTDPHSYNNFHLEKIEMVWTDGTSNPNNAVGDPVVVWNGDGSKVAGPSAPTVASENNMKITFQWSDVVNLTPPAGAVNVDFVFYLGGTVTDADGSSYSLSSNINHGFVRYYGSLP